MKKLFSLAILATTACDLEKSCTEVGCINGITIEVYDADGEPSQSAHGTFSIMSSGMEEVLTFDFDCREADSGALCSDNLVTFVLDDPAAIPADAMYLYTINTNEVESFSDSGNLSFEESTPNGDDCPPTCFDMQLEATMERPVDEG